MTVVDAAPSLATQPLDHQLRLAAAEEDLKPILEDVHSHFVPDEP
ncbi:MAG: hypothetical protein QM765_20915 [Myxococcales bacterium]